MVRPSDRTGAGRADQRLGSRGRVQPFGLYCGERLVAYGELWVDDDEAEVALAAGHRLRPDVGSATSIQPEMLI